MNILKFQLMPLELWKWSVAIVHQLYQVEWRLRPILFLIWRYAFLDSLNVCLLPLKKYDRFTCYIQASYNCLLLSRWIWVYYLFWVG